MAATGNTVTLQSGAYQGRYMKLTCTSTSNPSTNKTTISWKLESIGGSSSYYATICRVYIAGTEVYNIDKGYSYKQFPVAKGETTGSITVEMDNSGNKLIYVDMDVAIYTSSTTRYSVDGGWQLPTVPRYPTISSFSVNKISGSSTSLSFVWSASAPGGNISKLEYSTDNGASFKTASSVTSPLTVSGLASAQGYTCKIRVTSSASGLTATSSGVYQTTYQQPSATISTANISGYNGISQVKVSWSSNMTISTVKYSKDNGATWSVTQSPNAKSGNYTFTGLTEGSTPNFKVQVTAATGSCVTTSGTSQKTLYTRVKGNLYVNGTKVATNNGQTGVALKNGDTLQIKDISNPGNLNYKLFFENPDNQHQYTSSATSGTNTLSMDASKINERLQYFTNDPSQGFNVGIVTLNDSSQHALYHEFFGTISAVNVNPTFDENRWTYQDTNATTVALTGSNQILVNGFSKLRVSVNTAASGNGYATIKQYAVSGCTSGSSSTTGNIDCANATNGGTIKVTAKDSRNNVTETTKTATFKDYFVPTLTSISATRSNGGVGTQTSMTFNGTWWNANFGASNNTIAASYRYKSGSTWSSSRAITLTTSGNNYSFNDTIYGDLAADGFTLGTTFTIEVTITDALNGGKQWTTTLSSGTPAIAISGSNVAVGAQYDTSLGGKLQVHGDIKATGNISAANYKTISLSGGSGNTTGYRCFAAFTATTWNNYRAVMIVRSRHSGNGLLTVGVSFGSTASTLSGTPSFTIDGNVTQFGGGDAWVMRVDGSKVELWWKYYDYNDTTITVLNSNFNIVSGGTWQTSLPSGGTKYYACNSAYPIGAIYLSWDSTSPATLFGGTWERVGQGGFLYSCVNGPGTGNGTGTSTGGSSAANTGQSSGSTGGPSNNNTGGVTLTAAQSGLRQHGHSVSGNYAKDVSKQNIWGSPIWSNSDGSWCGQYSSVSANDVSAANATSSHSHTLNSHTHSLNSHTHSMAHTHGVPYVAIYMWKRTA